MDPGSVVFGRYLLMEQLGAGAEGVVWKATDQQLHQTVALKRVPFAGLDGAQARLTRGRALREARLAAQLRSHPHVVTVYDVLTDDSDIWLVMEYLQARSLNELLRAEGPLAPVYVARIGAQIADALAAAHALGIEHRDVKPGNVLIGANGIVKLTDFGISHLTGDPHLTHTGITGTPAYLAPEVAADGDTSPASDVFSLGATLYAAVEGQPPFGADDNILRLLKVVRTGIIRPPTRAGPIEPLLERLLHVDPTTRPDAGTTRDLLTRLVIQLTNSTERARTTKPTRRWWRKPAPRVSVITAALIAAATATAWVIVLRTPQDLPVPPPSVASSDLRNADPCSLINLDSLRRFGEPRLTTPPLLQSCQTNISPIIGGDAELQIVLQDPTPVSELEGTPDLSSDPPIIRTPSVQYWGARDTCRNYLVPAPDQPVIAIYALTYSEKTVNLCGIAEAATTAAVEALRQNGGITYTPHRTSLYSHATSDACTILDRTTLEKILELNPGNQLPGFANWSCVWGTADNDGARVTLELRLESLENLQYYRRDFKPIKIADKAAFEDGRGQRICKVKVVHRSIGTALEIFEVHVDSPLSTEERCARATELATAAEERLPDT